MVRSIFEHASVLWPPSHLSIVDKFEAIQNRAIKWILNEQFYVYSNEYYTQKLIDLDILPMAQKFIFNDLIMFYKIMNELVPVGLPSYITLRSNTRSCVNRDTLGIDSQQVCYPIKSVFGQSFFPRCISTWNHLAADIKVLKIHKTLISSNYLLIKKYIWNLVIDGFDDSRNSTDLEPD